MASHVAHHAVISRKEFSDCIILDVYKSSKQILTMKEIQKKNK